MKSIDRWRCVISTGITNDGEFLQDQKDMFDKANQAPSRLDIKPSSPPKKPIRPSDDSFQLDSNIEEYSSIWDQDNKLSTNLQNSIQIDRGKIEHHQKEILNNKRTGKTTGQFDSARVDSTIDTETHSCVNFSSSKKIDELIAMLNNIHTELDQIIKHRTGQISNETETILLHIQNETQMKQQRLLTYAKDQQSKNDERYRKLLEEYLEELDRIKAQDLAELQKQLEAHREGIFEESQLKILTVNDQANSAKAKILQNEQDKATRKIDSTMTQLNQLFADEKVQHLGNESITRTQIISHANVGTKAAGQHCTFDINQIDPPEQSNRRVSINRKAKNPS